jgi:hypothetical protein
MSASLVEAHIALIHEVRLIKCTENVVAACLLDIPPMFF